MEINQYTIILVNLDPTVGSEIKKTRPCVVISPNEMNQYLNTVIVAPITTTMKDYPTRIKVKHNGKNCMIAIDQIRTIDKKRIVRTFDKLKTTEIFKCKSIIKETLVD